MRDKWLWMYELCTAPLSWRVELVKLQHLMGCVFLSQDGINPARDEITRTRLMCSGVKERHKQLRCVCFDVANGWELLAEFNADRYTWTRKLK